MTNSSLAQPAQSTTRELRGLRLYLERSAEIRYEDGTWFVPSQQENTTVYEVVLGRRGESCKCDDYGYRHGSCVHIYAASVATEAKTAPCSGCGQRYAHRDLTEVRGDHLTCFEGDLLCPECAADHGTL